MFAHLSTPLSHEIKAVIFDCDGVLVDTEFLKFQAWKKALATIHIDLSIEEYKQVVGYSSKKIVERLSQMKQIPIPEEVLQKRKQEYHLLQAQGVPPLPETVAFATQLSAQKDRYGIKMGLASSASHPEILINLKQVGLENAFDLIISGSDDLDAYKDPEGKNKPKPYLYQEAAKRLGIEPQYCLVFEDTEAGIEAAAGAGMIAVAIPNELTKDQDFSKGRQVIQSISEFKIFPSQ